MTNPFANRAMQLSGPARDIEPVTPNDNAPLQDIAVALYVEIGGTLSILTEKGETRTVAGADCSILPVGVRQVRATGTTASGIHAFLVS